MNVCVHWGSDWANRNRIFKFLQMFEFPKFSPTPRDQHRGSFTVVCGVWKDETGD